MILTDENNETRLVINADGCLRAALFDLNKPFDPYVYCHRSLVVRDLLTPIGDVLPHLKDLAEHVRDLDEELELDVILVWAEQKRISTGTDILGRLLKGISRHGE